MRGNFSETVTLYNRGERDGVETFTRAVLDGVEIMDRVGEAVRHSGAASSSARRTGPVSVSEMTVLIPKGVRSGYLQPKEWRQTENHEGSWTLAAGDFLVPESCDVEVRESISELTGVCGRVAVIGTVRGFDGGGDLCHWEVTAR